MKYSLAYSLLLLLNIFSSCSPNVTSNTIVSRSPIDYNEKIELIELNQIAPIESIVIAKIKIEDTGFTNKCDYYTVLETAKLEARKLGGNAIKLTKHTLPNAWSTCHRIEADVLFVEDIENLDEFVLEKEIQYKPIREALRISDIIYRTNGQEVICEIYNEDDTNVYFTIVVNENVVKTQLPRDQINDIIYSNKK